jgi:DNA-binding MarR family transcriptional regulator
MGSRGRRRIGQLLVQMNRLFRVELFQRLTNEEGLTGVRPAHLHVFANLVGGGKRLTELADAASMKRSSMQELVDELQRNGIVERQPDPSDGRAKLIVLTKHGLRVLEPAGRVIASIEEEYARTIGPERFEEMCLALDELVDTLLDAERSEGEH